LGQFFPWNFLAKGEFIKRVMIQYLQYLRAVPSFVPLFDMQIIPGIFSCLVITAEFGK
jgi:hypothetical protein